MGRQPAPEAREGSVAVSVIVPSYNSAATLRACLHSLAQQDLADAYEVLVVDSSDDGSGRRLAAEFPAVRWTHLGRRTLPGAARNRGIEQAQGALLAFTDADCVVPPEWLRSLVTAQAASGAAAVGGSIRNHFPRHPVAWSGWLVEFSDYLPSAPARAVDLLPTCNVIFARRVFDDHGRFPEDLWPAEDQLFCWRLVQAGEALAFQPAISVSHQFRRGLGDYLRHMRRLGVASAAARRRAALPGAWLASHPLRYAAALLRLGRIEWRLLRRDLGQFVAFNLLLPVSIPGLVAFGLGFVRSPGKAQP